MNLHYLIGLGLLAEDYIYGLFVPFIFSSHYHIVYDNLLQQGLIGVYIHISRYVQYCCDDDVCVHLLTLSEADPRQLCDK